MPLPGTLVPSGRRGEAPERPLRCHGLLLADDLVGLGSDPGELQTLCSHITTWCTTNEMEVGIKKCGIMEFEGDNEHGCAMASVLPDAALQATMQLCDQAVPLVDRYTYLGIEITKSLSYQDLLGPRVESGRKTIRSLQSFLASVRSSPCPPAGL